MSEIKSIILKLKQNGFNMSKLTKFQECVIALASRLGDKDFDVYTKEKLSTYINSSMEQIFMANVENFQQSLSEFIEPKDISVDLDLDGKCLIKEIAGNCYKVISGITDGNYIRLWPNEIYYGVKAGTKAFYKPDKIRPAMFDIGGRLEILGAGKVTNIIYLKNTRKSDGSMFIYEDTEEIAFTSIWLQKIVEGAEILARKDNQDFA